MHAERIDFISAYCDRWCERCAYTARCSAYACQIAAEMCGDLAEGIELAVGTPHPESGESEEPLVRDWLADFDNVEPSASELEAFRKEEAARDDRIGGMPLSTAARRYAMLSHAWLNDHFERLRVSPDPVVAEALEVVAFDSVLIGAKLHRALDGRDRCRRGEDVDDDPVQNDWNGSAKVALISIERSDAAWQVIGQATGDATAATMADQMGELRRLAHDEFPTAMSFVRPGFDEPWR